ncbi:MAG: hypothetical protein P4L87_25540 [Formivibrio sp.]|nr:hypothetical protein [Formivibrio sp.]
MLRSTLWERATQHGVDHLIMMDAIDVDQFGIGANSVPPLSEIQAVSKMIAFAAQEEGKALQISDERLHLAIESNCWQARHRDYRRSSV